jgi:hypothetical protein
LPRRPQVSSEFLQSHPLSKHRARRFAEAHDRRGSYRPALDGEQAKALAAVCAEAKDPPEQTTAE